MKLLFLHGLPGVGKFTVGVATAGGEVVFVELICSDEELHRRVASQERRKFGKLDSVELLDALRADGTLYSLAVPRSARSAVVDTTDRAPAESASEISRLIGD